MSETPAEPRPRPAVTPPVPGATVPADDPVMPRSGDESSVGWGESPESDDRDAAWYQRERPPHHGD